MKSKLIFRILGAISSALIIVSVFIPFIKVVGYSQSLWQTNSTLGTLYLPIMIIVFGAIGVLVFSINIKTELAYATAGALLFYLIMQTVPVINQGVFNTLNAGYYCLAVGTVLTAIMAFLCGLKLKQKEVETNYNDNNQTSMLEQIDRLYDNENNELNDMQINQIDVIQPLQPINTLSDNLIEPVQPIPVENNEGQISELPSENNLVSNPTNNMVDLTQSAIEQPVQPEVNIGSQEIKPVIIQNNNEMVPPTIVQPNIEPNTPIQNLGQEQTVQNTNPVVVEFEKPVSQNVNPVVSEFSPQNNSTGVNPVVAEFSVPSEHTMISTPIIQEQTTTPSVEEEIKPLSSDTMSTLLKEQNNNESNLDIFG